MIWDAVDARRVQQLVQEATGEDCPCIKGDGCPLLTPETISLIRDMTRRATLTAV